MKRTAKKLTAMALALVLSTIPLAACGGQASTGDDAATDQSTQAATIDVSGWKTVGDAAAGATARSTSSWDENYIVSAYDYDGVPVRVVAQMTPEVSEALNGLDIFEEDYEEQFEKTIADLPIVEAQDLSSEMLSQEQIDALIGKKGQDLLNDGFALSCYTVYGGEETGAMMDKGLVSYDVMFEGTVAEPDDSDGGAAIKDMKVNSITFLGASNAAVDPTQVKSAS